MASVRVERTLVKSPPELWEELADGGHAARWMAAALGARPEATEVVESEPERHGRWMHAIAGARRAETAVELERKGWGTHVALTAEIRLRGLLARRRERHAAARLETALQRALDGLGSASRRPFSPDRREEAVAAAGPGGA